MLALGGQIAGCYKINDGIYLICVLEAALGRIAKKISENIIFEKFLLKIFYITVYTITKYFARHCFALSGEFFKISI